MALLALAAGLVGCGGAPKRDFVARADAICAGALRETRAIAPPTPTGGEAQQLSALSRYLAQVLRVVQKEATQLSALRGSTTEASNRAELARYLGALARIVANYQELVAAAKRGDAQGVANAEAALRASPIASLARAAGLRYCGTAGATTP